MGIANILHRDSIMLNLATNDKYSLLETLVNLAAKSGKIKDINNVVQKVIDREKLMSTGVGKGIALPHAKTNAVEDSVAALAILKNEIDFDSIDGKPVKLVFLLLGHDSNVGNHLRLLSMISRILNNDSFRNKLINASSQDEILKHFQEIDNDL